MPDIGVKDPLRGKRLGCSLLGQGMPNIHHRYLTLDILRVRSEARLSASSGPFPVRVTSPLDQGRERPFEVKRLMVRDRCSPTIVRQHGRYHEAAQPLASGQMLLLSYHDRHLGHGRSRLRSKSRRYAVRRRLPPPQPSSSLDRRAELTSVLATI